MFRTEHSDRMCILVSGRCCMGRKKALKEAKEALANALQGLEEIRMTRRDDPKLIELKADIRRSIDSNQKSKVAKAA
jgi:hypothetical protein